MDNFTVQIVAHNDVHEVNGMCDQLIGTLSLPRTKPFVFFSIKLCNGQNVLTMAANMDEFKDCTSV